MELETLPGHLERRDGDVVTLAQGVEIVRVAEAVLERARTGQVLAPGSVA